MTRFLAALLSVLLVFSPAFANPPSVSAKPTIDRDEVDAIVYSMLLPGVEVGVAYAQCGYVNAFYYPSLKAIVLCEELAAEGKELVRFVVAHEMAHAIIYQLDIPYTGSGEAAADELAAVFLGVMGRGADVIMAGAWWLDRGQPENPRDDHSGDIRRGRTLACLGAGAIGLKLSCSDEWDRALNSWMKLLGVR